MVPPTWIDPLLYPETATAEKRKRPEYAIARIYFFTLKTVVARFFIFQGEAIERLGKIYGSRLLPYSGRADEHIGVRYLIVLNRTF